MQRGGNQKCAAAIQAAGCSTMLIKDKYVQPWAAEYKERVTSFLHVPKSASSLRPLQLTCEIENRPFDPTKVQQPPPPQQRQFTPQPTSSFSGQQNQNTSSQGGFGSQGSEDLVGTALSTLSKGWSLFSSTAKEAATVATGLAQEAWHNTEEFREKALNDPHLREVITKIGSTV